MKWFVDYVWQRLQEKDMATKAWVEAKGYATETWVLAKGYATEAWVEARGYLATSFVDRGDPAARDFGILNFTADGAWHDLDLSSIVPKGAISVLLGIKIKNVYTSKIVYVRKKGNTNVHNASACLTQVARLTNCLDIVCPCDPDRKCQYLCSANNWQQIDLTVKGWWL